MAEPKVTDLLKNCECVISEQNISDFPELQKILPPGYEYTMCTWVPVNEEHFDCRFRINIHTEKEAVSWLNKFHESSRTSFIRDKAYPAYHASTYVYKVRYKCDRNFRSRAIKNKPYKTCGDCPSRLVIIVNKTKQHYPVYPKSDVHLEEFPTTITFRNRHNHCTDPKFALKYSSPTPEVKNMFMKYFQDGLTPTKAFETYEAYLKETYKDEFSKVMKDGSLYPNIKWVFKLHGTFKRYQDKGGNQWQRLVVAVGDYNRKMKGRFAEFRIFDVTQFFIVVVTPLMKRVLENVKDSSEVLFTDSAFADDYHSLKILMLFTNSCGRDLPVGSIISTSDTVSNLTAALELYKTFLNGNCFGGRGSLGPRVIMTDYSWSESDSLAKAFPDAIVQRCPFHVLRAAWKHVMTTQRNLTLEQRLELYLRIKSMVNSKSEDELATSYAGIKAGTEASEFLKFRSFVDELYAQKDKWSRYLPKRQFGLNESAVRIIKDHSLKRLKSYSTYELFDFIISDTEKYYAANLLPSNDYPPERLSDKISFEEGKTDDYFILAELDDDSYKVVWGRNRTEYLVNMNVGACSCTYGMNGAICQHQVTVTNKNKKLAPAPLNPEQRALLSFIAEGGRDSSSQSFTLNDDSGQKLVFVPYNSQQKAVLLFLPDGKNATNQNSAVSLPQDSKQKAVLLFLGGTGKNNALDNSVSMKCTSNQQQTFNNVSAEDLGAVSDSGKEEDDMNEMELTDNFSSSIMEPEQVVKKPAIKEYSGCDQVSISDDNSQHELASAPHNSPQRNVIIYYFTRKKDAVKHSFSSQSASNHPQSSDNELVEDRSADSEHEVVEDNGEEAEHANADSSNSRAEQEQVDKKAVLKEFNDCIQVITDKAEHNSEVFSAVEKFVSEFKKTQMGHSSNLAHSLQGLLNFEQIKLEQI